MPTIALPSLIYTISITSGTHPKKKVLTSTNKNKICKTPNIFHTEGNQFIFLIVILFVHEY